jgi:hypothetical protein
MWSLLVSRGGYTYSSLSCQKWRFVRKSQNELISKQQFECFTDALFKDLHSTGSQ